MPSVHHIGTTSVRQPLRGGPAVVPETCRLDCLFPGPDAGRVRTPQQARSRATQQRLLAATVDCLIGHGWSGTTTTLVAEKAGVSRGAQLHHYPTKAALVLAAVEHLAARRAAEIRAEAASLPVRRLDRAVALLAAAFTGPLYTAALEVWVAARTDPPLRAALVPLEARVGRELHRLARDLLGAGRNQPGVRETVQATLDLLRGLGVAHLLSADGPRRRRILAAWTANLATLVRPA